MSVNACWLSSDMAWDNRSADFTIATSDLKIRDTNHRGLEAQTLRVDNRFSCWNWLRLCVCTGCIMCIDTTWYNNFLDSSSDGQKISSQRSWWLSTGQRRKAAEHPFPHDLLLPAFDVETLVIYKARACVCHLLNKVNAHAKSDWIAFCELHILAKSTQETRQIGPLQLESGEKGTALE